MKAHARRPSPGGAVSFGPECVAAEGVYGIHRRKKEE